MSENRISYKGIATTYKYEDIIKNEVKLKTTKNINSIIDINALYILQISEHDIRNTTIRLLEIAKNSTVLRCGLVLGNVTTDKIAYESDGAHTNLMRALVKYAMDFVYGWGNNSLLQFVL